MHDNGLFPAETARRLLGSWFGYPQCCIDFHIKIFDKPDLSYICIVNHPKLGEYVQCHKCWNKVNVMKTQVARDSKQHVMWVKGRTDLSFLTYREWREGMDMIEGGTISKDGHTFHAPFTIKEEEIPK